MVDSTKDYIGKVIYTDDTTFSGRCKIRVFGVFDELEDSFIPWFSPMNMNVFSSYGGGNISIPKVGDVVRVKFNNSNIYSGEYSALQNIDPHLIEEIKDDYQGTHVLLYDADQELIVVFQPNSGLKASLRGSLIRIGADGIIQATHQNNTSVIEMTDSEINITTAGSGSTINIYSANQVTLNAPKVSIDSNSVSVGNNAKYHAVKGEELQKVLKQIAIEIAAKTPQGSGLAAQTFSNILSSDVTVR